MPPLQQQAPSEPPLPRARPALAGLLAAAIVAAASGLERGLSAEEPSPDTGGWIGQVNAPADRFDNIVYSNFNSTNLVIRYEGNPSEVRDRVQQAWHQIAPDAPTVGTGEAGSSTTCLMRIRLHVYVM